MQNNKCFFLVFLFVVATKCGYSQQQESSADEARGKKYSLLLYLSGGAGYFPSNSGAPTYLQPKRTRINPVLTARVMWKPDHRLKAGLETGFVTFYSYRLTDENGKKGRISLDAVPILLEFSVSVKKHFNLFAGPGVYVLKTNLDYEGKTVSQKVNPGWMAAAAYTQPITKGLSIGAEAKWLYATETIRGSFGLQAQVLWRFFRW